MENIVLALGYSCTEAKSERAKEKEYELHNFFASDIVCVCLCVCRTAFYDLVESTAENVVVLELTCWACSPQVGPWACLLSFSCFVTYTNTVLTYNSLPMCSNLNLLKMFPFHFRFRILCILSFCLCFQFWVYFWTSHNQFKTLGFNVFSIGIIIIIISIICGAVTW